MIQKTLLEESHAHGKLSAAETLKISLTVSSIITFQSGIITLALGLFRLGFIDAVLSRALLRGFISAIALVILVAQLPTMLGMNSLISPEGTIEKLLVSRLTDLDLLLISFFFFFVVCDRELGIYASDYDHYLNCFSTHSRLLQDLQSEIS